MKKTMKTGISLIVMLITIVVIIILAASIINTVIYNNPMDNAKEATFRSDLQEMKSAYGIRQGDLMAKYKGDKNKITEEDYEGVVHRNYEGEILAFEEGLAYLGQDKKKQEIAESMDYIIGNPNESILRKWDYNIPQEDFHKEEYRTNITKINFIKNNKVPKGVIDSWDVSEKNNGAVMAWIVDDGNEGYELTIGGNGKVVANKNSGCMFRWFTSLKEIDMKALDTSMVTDMNRMFDQCHNLTTINFGDKVDTSNVTTVYYMFCSCTSLKSVDISKFDTSSVIDMGGMFIDCSNLINTDVSHFDTSSVKSMWRMFSGCRSLTSIDVSGFKTNKVTNMENMFSGCSSLASLDVSNFDTSGVIYMGNMFNSCRKIKTSITIKNPETTSYSNMFINAATENGAEIKVNYTSETLDLVNDMINTKSEKSNVILGNEVII